MKSTTIPDHLYYILLGNYTETVLKYWDKVKCLTKGNICKSNAVRKDLKNG